MQAVIPTGEATDSDFGAFMEAAPSLRPDPASIVTVPLWGIKWGCSFDGGRLVLVLHQGRWVPARATLRDSICDALESAYAEMAE